MSTLIKFLLFITLIQWGLFAGVQAEIPADGPLNRSIKAAGFTLIGTLPGPKSRAGQNTNNDYLYSHELRTWTSAYDECEFLLAGNLVSIETKEEDLYINEFLNVETVNMVWTSGRYYPDTKKWFWMPEKKEITFTNWNPKSPPKIGPSQRIAYTPGPERSWGSYLSSNRNFFLCEITDTSKVPPCKEPEPISLAVVLDSSWSIEEYDKGSYNRAKYFIYSFVEPLVTKAKAKVTFMTYGTKMDIVVPFKNNLSWNETGRKIWYAKYQNSKTYTHLGIKTAIEELGDAPNKVMVVLTDGVSDFPDLTTQYAKTARDKDILTFAVGISRYFEPELDIIAGDPTRKFTVNKVDEMKKHMLVPLSNCLCKGGSAKMRSSLARKTKGRSGSSLRSRSRSRPDCKKRKFYSRF